MASSFPFPAVPVFGERECQGEPGVKGDRSVESHALLSLESLDKACGTGGEKLFQMLVRQFLVQESAVHGQSAPFIVATGTLFPDDNVSGLAFGTGECAGGCRRKAEVQDFTGSLAGVVRDGWKVIGYARKSRQVKIKRKSFEMSMVSVFCQVEKKQVTAEY